ncbi:zf-CCHC domain-containing protein [Tanacetum coccineum]
MSTQQDINAIRAQRLANTHDPLALMANTQTPFRPDHSSHITYIQHPQPNNNFVQQPSFNTNYMQQPMQNPKDSSDPTTAMNTSLALLDKAFKVNTMPTNNNQTSLLIPYNSQIAQPGMNMSQDIKMKMLDDNVGNQVRHNAVQYDGNKYGNGDVVTAPAEGNCNGINGNPIRCYNCRGEGHYASNCTVKSRKQDAAYLQQQLQIAQEEEAGIQSTQDNFIEFECLLEINEQVCPHFILEFYSQYHLSYSDEGEMFVEFVIQNQLFSYSLENFAQILGVPCEGACVFTDRWRLDELACGVPSDGPISNQPSSSRHHFSLSEIDREGQVRRNRHRKKLIFLNIRFLTREI